MASFVSSVMSSVMQDESDIVPEDDPQTEAVDDPQSENPETDDPSNSLNPQMDMNALNEAMQQRSQIVTAVSDIKQQVGGIFQPQNISEATSTRSSNNIGDQNPSENAAAPEQQLPPTNSNISNGNPANAPPPPPPQQQFKQEEAVNTQPQRVQVPREEGQEKAPSRTQSGGGVALPTYEEDSTSLNLAFKGNGCDVGKIVEILSNRDAPHIEDIKIHYLKAYKEELSVRLSSELSSLGKGDIKEKLGFDLALSTTLSLKFSNDLKRALLLWILDEAERDATIVWQGLSVASVDLEAVTEVICSRTPSQLGSLKQAYFSLYNSQLIDDIQSNVPLMVSPTHKQLLIACLDGQKQKQKRDEGTDVDHKLAEEDAKQLYQDGENKWGTNDKTFVDIFTKRNRPHLAEVDATYNRLYGHSLEQAVVKETSRYFRDGLLILLKCAKNSAQYFAEVLHKAMEGMGTSDTKLVRVVVTRARIDMEEIKNQYCQAYKVSLKNAIHSNTSGPYRTFLVNLVK